MNTECKRCGSHYELRDGYDPTPFCDECAHLEVERLTIERDAWKAKAERTCGISEIPGGSGLFYLMTNCGGHVNGRSDWCPHCGGRIVKEEKP